jgi:hypothetical protein
VKQGIVSANFGWAAISGRREKRDPGRLPEDGPGINRLSQWDVSQEIMAGQMLWIFGLAHILFGRPVSAFPGYALTRNHKTFVDRKKLGGNHGRT